MPKPPREALGRFAKKVVTEIKSNSRNFLEFWIASSVFILAIIELVSWFFQTDNTAVIADVGDEYLVYWYPLLCSISFMFIGLMLVIKCIRYTMCIYTIIASWMYLVIQIINTICILFSVYFGFYELFAQPVILSGVVLFASLNFIRWGISN